MDKWEKVVLLHRTLRTCKYCVPLKTIMAELECSEATFHRVRGFMQISLGAPIVFDRTYGGYWYVDAYCHLRKKLRTFALDRLTKAEPVTDKYHFVSQREREKFFASAYGIFTGPATKLAVIDFTGTCAREVSHEQWHPKQSGQWLNDMTYRLIVPYGHSRELIMDILRWGEFAEVKAPKDLREQIGKAIKRAMKNYEK